MENTKSNTVLLKFSVMMLVNSGLDLKEVTDELIETGFDELTSGGFWIQELGKKERFYSQLFRENIGYEGEHDFPSLTSSWRDIINVSDLELAVKKFNKLILDGDDENYDQEIRCTTKDGTEVTFLCSGKLLKMDGKYKFLVGTHKKK